MSRHKGRPGQRRRGLVSREQGDCHPGRVVDRDLGLAGPYTPRHISEVERGLILIWEVFAIRLNGVRPSDAATLTAAVLVLLGAAGLTAALNQRQH